MNKEDSTTIIFKNIPKQIKDLTSLLNSLKIPAKNIKPFGRTRALITYEFKTEADHALETLQELEFSGKHPNVSLFCKDKPNKNIKETIKPINRKSHKSVQTSVKDSGGYACQSSEQLTQQQVNKYVQKLYAIEGNLGFDQPPAPYLKYSYPPINKDILDNICISLLSNKRFYNQVLHLMNRMNLEPPFGERNFKFSPKGEPKEAGTQTEMVIIQEAIACGQKLPESEEIESELESSEEDVLSKVKTKQHIKRKLPAKEDQYKKKAKQIIQSAQKLSKESAKKSSTQKLSIKEIFDTSEYSSKPSVKIDLQLKHSAKVKTIKKLPKASLNIPLDLKVQKLSSEELETLSIYKNYQRGAESNKLYIKNLHKDVTTEDLSLIYKRYLKDNCASLDIKVMQQGRMKGQAFVTFQTEHLEIMKPIISQALDDTNGQLGLIDTIYVDGGQPQNNNTSTKSSKSKLSLQSYEYVIAVDFEATCWENKAPPKWRESEIIEFPAILVNLKTGKIEAEFHKYIMPIESPKLSAFCTELTGITQKTVDNGIPLQTALMMFQEWLRKELRSRHLMLPKVSKDNKIGNCAFVTWTDWDFGICLDKECSRKRIKKPPYFNQWIDMRVIYREWYKYKPLNFLDALTHVGLNFEGKQHSGIDDAKNLAALTHKLVNDGATLAITKDLTPFQLNLNCVF